MSLHSTRMPWWKVAALVLVAGGALMLGAGCAGSGPADEQADVVARPPDAETAYRLRVGDLLSLIFPTDRTLDYETPVTPTGTITIPSGVEVMVAGRTIPEVKAAIEEGMSGHLRDPAVSVLLVQLAEQPVYVLGEVQKPGRVLNDGALSVTMALAEAGGLLRTGKPSSVMVIRSVGVDETMSFKVDVTKVLDARDISQDARLMPYDIVFVPKSVIGKVGEFVDLFFDDLAGAQLFYLRGYDILNRGPIQLYQ